MPKDQEVRTTFVAEVKGEKELEKFAEAVEEVEKVDDVDVKVGADTKKAQQQLKELDKLVEGLTDDEQAVIIKAVADQARKEVRELESDLAKIDDPRELRLQAGEIVKARAAVEELETKLGGLGDAGKRASVGVDDIGRSAGSSRSVLANMTGNAVQDLGALGGIAGSTGVAIGQMGEYMADAAGEGDKFGQIAANFGKVLGPVALLSTALAVATGLMKEYQEQQAASAKRTEDFGQAMQDSADDTLGLVEVLRDSSSELRNFTDAFTGINSVADDWANTLGSKIPGAGKLFEEEATDLIDVAKRAGLSIFDLAEQVEAGGAMTDEFAIALREAKASGAITKEEFYDLADGMKQYGKEAADAKADTENLAEVMRVNAEEANTLLTALELTDAPLEHFTDRWQTLFDDMADGTIDTEAAAEAINFLAEALGLSQEKVLELARAQLENTDAADAAAKAAEEEAEAFEKMQDALHDAAAEFDIFENKAGAFARTFDHMGEQTLDNTQRVADLSDAYIGLSESWKDNAEAGSKNAKTLDVNTEAGKQNLDALEQLRDQYGSMLTAQLEQGAGYKDITAQAERWRLELGQQMGALDETGKATGENQEIYQQYLETLGLTPAQVETLVTLSKVEEANNKLEIYKGFIDSLPPDKQLDILATWSTDPIAAVGQLDSAIATANASGKNKAKIGTEVTPPTDKQISEAIPKPMGKNAIKVPLEVDAKTATTEVGKLKATGEKKVVMPLELNKRAAEAALTTFIGQADNPVSKALALLTGAAYSSLRAFEAEADDPVTKVVNVRFRDVATGQTLSRQQANATAGPSSVATASTVVHVHLPPGAKGSDVVAAQRRHVRRNGGRHA